MRLKNVMLTIEDLQRSFQFYHDLFGLQKIRDFGGNIMLTEGLVLQEKREWEKLIGRQTVRGDAEIELYFEEGDMDRFLEKLGNYPGEIRYVTPVMEYPEGRRVVRFYDVDGYLIEVGEKWAGEAR